MVRAERKGDRGHLLPAAARLPAAALALSCAVAFVALAVRYHDAVSYGRFDGWVNGWVPPRRDLPVAALASLTDIVPTVLVCLAGAVTVALLVLRRWHWAALTILGPGVTLLVVETAKPAVGRLHEHVLSLPSGHTAIVTSVALVGTVLVLGRLHGHILLGAAVGLVVVTAAAGAMTFLLLALRWHYATDTLAGYCVAVASTVGVAFGLDALASRAIAATGRPREDRTDRARWPSH